ncbi:hypothetical protein AAF712_012298 [Marasmius tenuissimus]|uniref:Uncharacterized protein n=1 Tax=Marasmius tenuissimus TaxID=585030 RepID=A0ABR2ZI70_9AGAR
MLFIQLVVVAALLVQQISGMVIPEGGRNQVLVERTSTQKPKAATAPNATPAIEKRSTTCPKGGKSPCACNGQIGLRASQLKNCPKEKLDFKDPTNLQSGELDKFPFPNGSRAGTGIQCDHLVELQFIKEQMTDKMCDHFLKSPKDMTAFRSFLNTSPDNLVLLNAKVNDAKGKCFNPSVKLGNEQAALGVVDYVERIKSDAKIFAGKIKDEMDRIAKAGGFLQSSFQSTFAEDYVKKLDNVISTYVSGDEISFPLNLDKLNPANELNLANKLNPTNELNPANKLNLTNDR